MINYYLDAFRNFSDFKGRARRSAYWFFVLCNAIVFFILALITGGLSSETPSMIGMVILGIYFLATIVPALALVVRRLHDVGKSGWMYLLSFIPLANLYLLYLLFQDSQPGENNWGPNPKGIGNTEDADDLIQTIGQ